MLRNVAMEIDTASIVSVLLLVALVVLVVRWLLSRSCS
jgi:hypothetical protein